MGFLYKRMPFIITTFNYGQRLVRKNKRLHRRYSFLIFSYIYDIIETSHFIKKVKGKLSIGNEDFS